jgi:hypothetical protein
MDAGQLSPHDPNYQRQYQIVPWLRKLIVTIGPLQEYKNATSGEKFEIVSDGTMNGIKVVCSIQRKLMGFAIPSTISIWNLKRETRNSIQRGLTVITVKAGWENTEVNEIYKGSIFGVVTERQGPDLVTKLTCLSGAGGILRGGISKTYGPNMPVKQVVKDLASKMEGVVVDDSNIKEVKGRLGKHGWSFGGMIKDALNQLAAEFGFSWSVDNNVFVAIHDKAKFQGMVIIDGKDGGLMQITPVLTGPFQWQSGVKIKSIFVPSVRPGSTVRVKSAVNPNLNGDYKIHQATFNLDCYSENWTMDLENFRLFGAMGV